MSNFSNYVNLKRKLSKVMNFQVSEISMLSIPGLWSHYLYTKKKDRFIKNSIAEERQKSRQSTTFYTIIHNTTNSWKKHCFRLIIAI